MALATLRPLLERPLRQYATFSGRSGRAEFWLFVLTFFVATSIAWPLGYGAMKLAGYESHDDKGTFHHHDPSEDGALDHDVLSDRLFGAHDRTAIFKLHRHPGEEGYHLHGLIGPLPDYDEPQTGRRGGRDLSLTFHMDRDDSGTAEDGAEILQGVVTVALLIPLLAVGARRLHDTGKTGWWQMFVLIPVAGWLVLLIFFLVQGDPKTNRFGPPAD